MSALLFLFLPYLNPGDASGDRWGRGVPFSSGHGELRVLNSFEGPILWVLVAQWHEAQSLTLERVNWGVAWHTAWLGKIRLSFEVLTNAFATLRFTIVQLIT